MRRSRLLVLLAWSLSACAAPRLAPVAAPPGPVAAAGAATTTPASPDLSYWEGRKDLIRPPAPPVPRPLALPRVERWTLPNGLEVIVVPRADLPVAAFGVAVKAGYYDEPRAELGTAAFTAEMLRRGTRSRSADQISAAIDAVGGSLSTSGGSEQSSVECTALSKDSALCLDLLADVLLRPTFPESEMGEVRDLFVGSINQRYDDPGTLAAAHLDNLLFGDDHPDGWAAMPEDVARIKRADLQRFWTTYYRPNNSLMVVAGDVDPARLRGEIARRLGPWRRAATPARRDLRIPERKGTRYLLVDKEDLTQATLMFGHPGISHTDPLWYDVTVMNYVLGGSDFSSRLMIEVRARRGLTYGIGSSFGASLYRGAFTVSAATKNESAWDALAASVAELRKMKAEGPTAAEVAKAHGYFAGSYPFKLQSAQSVAGSIVGATLHGLGTAYVEQLAVRLGQVDVARARAAAARHLQPDDLAVVIVGGGAAVAPQLERAGVKFERIGYRDAISAAERARPKQAP